MAKETLRQSRASVALICRHSENGVQWLARWNKNWGCYYFVGGHKHDDETYRECLVRELREELGISNEGDYRTAADPVAHLEYVGLSKSAKVSTEYESEVREVKAVTQYTIEIFDVRFSENFEAMNIDSRQSVRWLSVDEIRGRKCADGLPVSETMKLVLDKIGWNCGCVLSDIAQS